MFRELDKLSRKISTGHNGFTALGFFGGLERGVSACTLMPSVVSFRTNQSIAMRRASGCGLNNLISITSVGQLPK